MDSYSSKCRKIFFISIFFIFSFFLLHYSFSQEVGGILRAGVAAIDITPDLPVQMGGYSARTALSKGVHDRLIARVTAFENNGKRLVLVSCDLWDIRGDAIFRYLQKPILREFDLKEDELFLCATHSHASPSLAVDEKTGHPNNLKYTEKVKTKLINVIRDALTTMAPVHYGAGFGYSPIGMNRREMRPDGGMRIGRNPYGVTDKEVLVMKLAKPDGSNVAALINFGCHATSLGSRNLQISGDILGYAEKFVERIIDNGLIAPLFTGASGDVNPWFTNLREFNTDSGWTPETILLGNMLGTEVVHIFRDIKTLNSKGEIKTVSKTIEVPGKIQGDPVYKDTGLTETINIIAARVGDVAFVGFNVEMLTEIGMAIKDASPYKHTFVITHCNGYNNYLPPAHLFKEGGYEIMRSSFAPQAADIVVKEALRMLYSL